MRIGILGTGAVAAALGARWVAAGHEVVVAGRSPAKARALAGRIGGAALAPGEAVRDRDAVLLAVPWAAVEDVLREVGGPDGALAGTTLIDPTNAVQHAVGTLLIGPGESAAGRIAALAPGAHVVKAFHLLTPDHWTEQADREVTVALCGDEPAALDAVSRLVRDVGAVPAVLGGLDRARQLEEVAGFVIGLAFSGFDPAAAVPRVVRPGAASGTPAR
ncbi:NADPH-dependent F420 reductase [Pseudonocardia acaciae]|uniref:NADPH-dependent F420 reductase n=1 Tax=Pseudonocardia acaciae TaxID=551276 RepID=UPI0004905201|nr:NAD(P)-binding domain-containing protein [Pseudonocardia acaciae]